MVRVSTFHGQPVLCPVPGLPELLEGNTDPLDQDGGSLCVLSFLIRGIWQESLGQGLAHVPLVLCPLRYTPGVRGEAVTRQVIVPIRVPLPVGKCGASAPGPPEASASR